MSYSIRDRAQRKLFQTIGNIDSGLGYLAEVSETYKERFPDIADAIEKVAVLLMTCQEGVEQITQMF